LPFLSSFCITTTVAYCGVKPANQAALLSVVVPVLPAAGRPSRLTVVAVPRSIFEAARLDGATRLRTLWTIVLPIVAPGLGACAVFNLAAYWSEFCLALVLLDSQERFTMPLGLFSFQSAYETDWQLLAAASFIALVPVIAAFVLLQRFFVAGLTAGAVKG